MPHIVLPDSDETGVAVMRAAGLLQRLESLGSLTVHDTPPADDDDLVERAREAEVLVLGAGLGASAIARLPRLQLVSFCGIGASSYVDLGAATAAGVAVCNTPGYADDTVAEHTLALMLALTRRVAWHHAGMREGLWDQSAPSMELRGKTVGLIGWGGIARRTAELLRAFGAEILVWTRSGPKSAEGVRFVSIEELYARSDIISLHLALTEATRGLVDARAFAAMRPGVLLVNTARGAIVDGPALLDALRSGQVAGAALDVFDAEPLPADDPLRALANVVLTPHMAFRTPEAERALLAIAIDNVAHFLAGHPRNVLNPDALSVSTTGDPS